MHIGGLDWLIIGIAIAAIIGLAVYSKRFMRSTADFLAANRLAGRYLLTVSSGFFGAITIVAMWEMSYSSGLSPGWWGRLGTPIGLFISLSGFVIYRFRQTRSLTLAQFFEMRYSRNFRFFAGILCWISGLLNYGIFPAVTARFLITFLGLPEKLMVCGIPVGTFSLVMIAYLTVAVYIACSGGFISIMINCFFQNAFVTLVFIAILIFLVCNFSWSDVFDGLKVVSDPSVSLIDPFKSTATREFDLSYFLIGAFGAIYGVMCWQGGSGFGVAAKTPHEAVMANVLGTWRGFAAGTCIGLIPLVVYAVLHLDKFAVMAAPINEALGQIDGARMQMELTVPIALSQLLPAGLFGMFVVVIVCCAISCDSTYTHSWGTILVQDVVVPLRGKPLEPKTHLLCMRLAIIGVAVFGFIFSELFELQGFIYMFFALTAAIYTGGAGSVLIGGLYWKHGTTAAAWTAMSIGTVFGFGGLMLEQIWAKLVAGVFASGFSAIYYKAAAGIAVLAVLFLVIAILMRPYERFRKGARNLVVASGLTTVAALLIPVAALAMRYWLKDDAGAQEWFATSKFASQFPLTGAWIGFVASVCSVIGYVAVSLLGPRSVHDMDKLLHRGGYAVQTDMVTPSAPAVQKKRERFSWQRLIGIGDGFTFGERMLFICSFSWSMFWWVVFLVGTIVGSMMNWELPEWFWNIQWYSGFALGVVIGIACAVWILAGGVKNVIELFHDLKKAHIDEQDDGFVR